MSHLGVGALITIGVLAGCTTIVFKDFENPEKFPPSESLTEARSTLPDPSIDGAFVFDGVAESDPGPVKTYRLAVEAGEFLGEPAWFVAQESEERSGKKDPFSHRNLTMWLSPDLHVLRRDSSDGTARDPQGDATCTLAGALIFLRSCPARVASYDHFPVDDQSAPSIAVTAIDDDGTIHGYARTIDHDGVHVVLRGRRRELVRIESAFGFHGDGTLVPRESALK